jgi:hypothetical protein
MKQKNVKYFLLLGVAGIWGLILYKILSGVNDNVNDPVSFRQKPLPAFKDSANYEHYTLLLNYDDPFGAEENETLSSKTDSLLHATENFLARSSSNSSAPDISFIKYKGIIENSTTHKKAAIVSINGKDEFVRLNTKLPTLQVNAIQKNKILVTYEDQKFWIKRQ